MEHKQPSLGQQLAIDRYEYNITIHLWFGKMILVLPAVSTHTAVQTYAQDPREDANDV